MKLNSTMKRVVSALLVLVLLLCAVPVNVLSAKAAETPIDAAIIFTDLHSNKSNYKQSNIADVFGAVRKAGLPVSSVTSGGDAFSVNNDSDSTFGKYTGYTATINGYIRDALGNSQMPINYVWSDHDRYAVQEDGSTLLDKTSRLVYGAGNDGVYGTADDGNYYVYVLSMADTSTNDRYGAGFTGSRASKGFTASVEEAIANFNADAAKLLKDRPLLIVSHQPLLDNRNDNGHAYKWCTAINAVAETMDVAFFFGHNHKYDKSSDYYYAKGSTMSVCSDSSGNAKSVQLNFAHICGGYLEPTSSGSYSSSGTRRDVVMAVLIYEDSIQYTTYTGTGVYTGNYALNVTVPREHAATAAPEVPETTEPEATEPAPTEPEVTEPAPTEPAPTEPEVTEPAPTEPAPTEPTVPETPEEPEVTGIVWRKATSIQAGKRYILVNYGYNDSGVDTYAVNSTAGATAVTVKTDDNGAYLVTDDLSLAWTTTAKNSQFSMKNVETGKYLRISTSASSSSGVDVSVSSSVGTYGYWSLETKNNSQVLAVRRSSSSNYYPVRYTGSKFQAYSSSQVGQKNNWLAVFVETDEDLHQHKYATVTVAATCVTDGSVTASCACGHQTVEVLKATGHQYTCVETAASCTENGSKVFTCSVCEDTYTEVIPAVGHSYTAVTTEATCAQDGETVYTCVCGDTYTEVIPATGDHAYEAEVQAPTCEDDGYATYTCACGATYAQELAATGHDYDAVVTAPTCVAGGYTTYTCHCGESYVADEVAALGHDYTAKVTAPTCETAGYTTYTCACGDSYVADEVVALGHDYTAKITAPTCETAGYTTYTCACGERYVADEVAALGHDYTAKVTAPTCETAGYTTYTCACGESYAADEVAALGHSYTAKVTAPTCETAGYTTYTCACGDSYVADEVVALGHDYTAKVTAPTCETAGYTTYTCACGESYTGNQVAATGHNYTGAESDGYMVYTCACGHSYSEKLAPDLSYEKASSLSSGNSYVITLSSGSKYYAVSHKNNSVSAVEVKVSNGVITSEVTEDLIWECSGKKLSYESNGKTYYLYAKNSKLSISSSGTDITFSSNKVKLGSYYLRYSSGKISLNRSASTATLFKEIEN